MEAPENGNGPPTCTGRPTPKTQSYDGDCKTDNTTGSKQRQYDEIRNRLLRELRIDHIRTRQRLLHLEFVGSALRNHLVSVPEAMGMLQTPEMLGCFPEEAGT